MKSIIEELYYGNIEPTELNNGEISVKLKRKLKELTKSESAFSDTLTDKQKEELLRCLEHYNEFSSLSCADSFVTGFKLGARFACEMFT